MSAIITIKELTDTIESLERRVEAHAQRIHDIQEIIAKYINSINKTKALEEIKKAINKL